MSLNMMFILHELLLANVQELMHELIHEQNYKVNYSLLQVHNI